MTSRVGRGTTRGAARARDEHDRACYVVGMDPSAPPNEPSPAERCRTLATIAKTAMLSTIAREPAGYPFGSLVTVATDAAGRPLLLLSKLAEHTQNLLARSDASLLFGEAVDAEVALASARVTILGPCGPVPEPERSLARATFLDVHPEASGYVDFADFGFYRLEPLALRFVGGFGRMSWVGAEDYRRAKVDALVLAARARLGAM